MAGPQRRGSGAGGGERRDRKGRDGGAEADQEAEPKQDGVQRMDGEGRTGQGLDLREAGRLGEARGGDLGAEPGGGRRRQAIDQLAQPDRAAMGRGVRGEAGGVHQPVPRRGAMNRVANTASQTASTKCQ